MSRFCLCFLLTLALFTTACGYGSHYNMGGTGSPTLTSLVPATATAGDATFTLTVDGSNFGADSVVFWNGTALPSTYGTGNQVTATVSAQDVATAGEFPVYVRSAAKNSNIMNFTVQ